MVSCANITLATGVPDEADVRDRLLGLLRRYDLRKWQFTDQVRIERDAVSHSHPTLTIRAPMGDNGILLATYLHEQIHWFTLIPANRDAMASMNRKWRELYPCVPVEYPDGCGSERSNYLHFTVCYFTYRGLIEVVGDGEARRIQERQLAQPWYRSVNRAVRDDYERMSTVVAACGLAL